MVKMTMPPRFRATAPPRAVAAEKIAKAGKFRGSPAERGYDDKWNRLSIAYRKRHPFCERCLQRDRDTLAALVDHMIPAIDRPDLHHTWGNLWALCSSCHGWKFSMEVYARQNGQLDMLPTWCREPEKRPRQFRD